MSEHKEFDPSDSEADQSPYFDYGDSSLNNELLDDNTVDIFALGLTNSNSSSTKKKQSRNDVDGDA